MQIEHPCAHLDGCRMRPVQLSQHAALMRRILVHDVDVAADQSGEIKAR